jgi:hypothetical protein
LEFVEGISGTWQQILVIFLITRLFGAGLKEEEILVDHAEGGIHRSRNR